MPRVRKIHGTSVQRRTMRSHSSSRRRVASAAMPNANGIGHPRVAEVEERRMERHERMVLQQCVGSRALRPRRRNERERVARPGHDGEEEAVDDRQNGTDPWHKVTVALAVPMQHERRPARGEQRPEQDRALERGPEADGADERRRGGGVVLGHVEDAEVVAQQRDDHRHAAGEGGEEGADDGEARALGESGLSAPGGEDVGHDGVDRQPQPDEHRDVAEGRDHSPGSKARSEGMRAGRRAS